MRFRPATLGGVMSRSSYVYASRRRYNAKAAASISHSILCCFADQIRLTGAYNFLVDLASAEDDHYPLPSSTIREIQNQIMPPGMRPRWDFLEREEWSSRVRGAISSCPIATRSSSDDLPSAETTKVHRACCLPHSFYLLPFLHFVLLIDA